MHDQLGFVYGMYGYTSNSFIFFLGRAARVLIVAADRLGLSLGMPCMTTHSAPRFVFSQPRCMCASCGCMHARLGFVCATGGYTFISSIVFFCARLQGRQLWLQAGLAWLCVCPVWLHIQCLHLYISEPGCMHAWLGFSCALYGFTFNPSICSF